MLSFACASFEPVIDPRKEDPQRLFASAQNLFYGGKLKESASAALDGYRRFEQSSPAWAYKFKVLRSQALLWSGESEQALRTAQELPQSAAPDVRIEALAIAAVGYARTYEFEKADRQLAEATRLCSEVSSGACGSISRSAGIVAVQRSDYETAQHHFADCLKFARSAGDRFLESTALMNLGLVALRQEHYDEAITWLESADQLTRSIGARAISATTQGNLGWAYYKLGDGERSLEFSLHAEKGEIEVGDELNELAWILNQGYVYASLSEPQRAETSYERALALAKKLNSKADIHEATSALAIVSAQMGNLETARQYSQQALELAKEDQKPEETVAALFAQSQIEFRSGDSQGAAQTLTRILQDPSTPASMQWQAKHVLARAAEKMGRDADAESRYKEALETFSQTRSHVDEDELRLPFLANGSSLYDDYVQFLMRKGQANAALLVAEDCRGKTLAEAFDRKSSSHFKPAQFDPREVARRRKSAILFYWLGKDKSYLWAISPQAVSSFVLPPGREIADQVDRYSKRLNGAGDVLSDGDTNLYTTLVAPASAILGESPNITIVADGELHTLNFETLVVPSSEPHFWIEDVRILNASSLRLMGQAHPSAAAEKNLLLIGDPIPASPQYENLPKAGLEIKEISRHFPADHESVFTREQASPGSYLDSHPERFSYIHFVTHGTASRVSPLDSAVVLSSAAPASDSFKLYARQIVQHPIHADLVTISSCYGAGTRTYTGEGLVGLSWAFVRAGAHNVVGALWEASDASTPELMGKFYDGLSSGQRPEDALRNAKLSLLHSGTIFRKPFYWAPFQFYVGV
jgi:CHAT domain-containing protein/Flp pilus assembly protein TadD